MLVTSWYYPSSLSRTWVPSMSGKTFFSIRGVPLHLCNSSLKLLLKCMSVWAFCSYQALFPYRFAASWGMLRFGLPESLGLFMVRKRLYCPLCYIDTTNKIQLLPIQGAFTPKLILLYLNLQAGVPCIPICFGYSGCSTLCACIHIQSFPSCFNFSITMWVFCWLVFCSSGV